LALDGRSVSRGWLLLLEALATLLGVLALVGLSGGGAAYNGTFVDIAAAAGVTNPGGLGDPLHPIDLPSSGLTWKEFVSTMHMWGAVAIDDFDRDGDPDVYLTNNGTNVLYRNNGNWSFSEVAAAAGVATVGRSMGAAWADFDNDGCRDLFVASFTGPSTLYRSNCDGTFANVTAAANISIRFPAAGVSWGDYDRDGFLDLAVGCYVACPNALLHNRGDGTFAEVAASLGVADPGWTFQPVWVDYDRDGDLDLWDVNDFGYDKLYRNNDNSSFTDVSLAVGIDREGAGGMGIAVGDIDNDGWCDFFVTNYYNDSLYRSTHGGLDESFTGSPINDPLVGWGTEFFDAENDGDLDLFIANGFIFESTHNRFQDDKFLENTGNGRFANASSALGNAYGGVEHGAATADFDGDGDLDLFVFSLTGPSMLLRNDGPKGSWLKVNLTGNVSNRDAVGARVTAIADGRIVARFQMAGSSYLSQADHVLHLGLGSASMVDSLVIDWPSGAQQRFSNVSVDQTLDVTEPPALIARAAGDYLGRPATPVGLDASKSSDGLDPGFPLGANFTWTVDLGGTTLVLYGTTANVTLNASGAYRALLRVTDAVGNSDDDPFIVYIADERAPTARAGGDQTVCDGAAFLLDGGASTDNDPAFAVYGNYTWVLPLPGGPGTFYGVRVAVRIEVPGLYAVTLTARDPSGNRGTAGLTVTVNDCRPPTVEVPSTLSVTEGDTVVLPAAATDSSADFATDGNYSWTFTDGPGPLTVFGRVFAHTFAVPGIFPVALRVSDGSGNAALATVVVVVADVTAPLASVPALVIGDEGDLLRFDASNSTDNDPTFPASGTFTWTLSLNGSGQGPTTVLLFGISPVQAFSTPGRFPFVLHVSDRTGNAAVANGVVQIRDLTPPQIHAGPNLEVTQGTTVAFQATATDNDPAFASGPNEGGYVWSFEYGGSRVVLEGEQTSFRFERTGVYIVTLTVKDAAGNVATDHQDIRIVSGAADPMPMIHRLAVVAALVAVALVALPYWRRARRAGIDPEKGKPE
jgi:hypothetical protein